MRITGQYHARLQHVALAMCKDRDLAQDLTQEALVRAFESFASFQRDRPVMPWLVRILRNVHLNLVKSGRTKYEVAAHQMPEACGDPYETASTDDDPQMIAEHAELARWVREEIERLDVPYRLPFVLCEQQGFSYEETAEALAIPVGTVRSRLSRARALLRKRLLRKAQRDSARLPQAQNCQIVGTGKHPDL